MARLVKRLISDSCRVLLGRSGMARLGRFLYNEACLAPGVYPESLGDAMVRDAICRYARTRPQPFVVVDVGANVGEWSCAMADALTAAGLPYRIHACEAFPATYQTLQKTIHDRGHTATVIPHLGAVSSEAGERNFYAIGENMGTNSLHPIPGREADMTKGVVACSRLDDLADRFGVGEIGYLKIDTEGHDFEVLRGASGLLAAGRVRLLQFEYNHRWITSRHFLRDAFEYLTPFGLSLGRVTRLGAEFYDGWHHELESFREANFLAATPDAAASFPAVTWWNQPAARP